MHGAVQHSLCPLAIGPPLCPRLALSSADTPPAAFRYGALKSLHMGIALASSWQGPYRKWKQPLFPQQGEDPYVWQSERGPLPLASDRRCSIPPHRYLQHPPPCHTVSWAAKGLAGSRKPTLREGSLSKRAPMTGIPKRVLLASVIGQRTQFQFNPHLFEGPVHRWTGSGALTYARNLDYRFMVWVLVILSLPSPTTSLERSVSCYFWFWGAATTVAVKMTSDFSWLPAMAIKILLSCFSRTLLTLLLQSAPALRQANIPSPVTMTTTLT